MNIKKTALPILAGALLTAGTALAADPGAVYTSTNEATGNRLIVLAHAVRRWREDGDALMPQNYAWSWAARE